MLYLLLNSVPLMDQLEFRALAAAGLSFAIVVVLGQPTIQFLRRLKVGDAGSTDAEALQTHAASKANTPTMGGVLICMAILLSTLLLADISQKFVYLGLIVLVWLSVLGGFDDWLKLTAARRGTGRQGLYAWEKLLFQLGIGLLAAFFLYRHHIAPGDAPDIGHVLNLPLQRTYLPGSAEVNPGLIFLSMPVYVIIGVLLISGLSNAVNITDGMDGLAAGSGAVVSLGVMVLVFIAGTEQVALGLLVPHIAVANELAVLAGAMAGACLGFLWWNCSPAQVFMGDTGSLPLGGLLGYMAVASRQEIVVLLMCGVFLIEIASVVIQVGVFRSTGGKRVFLCAPYHHHLHLKNWTEQQVVARAWIVSAVLVVIGLASLKVR
jgi:phospho-N-acetylmuramoyl-pentapeptide-transferase